MSLQGALSDFGVADIFQLIAQQRKTGILGVERGKRLLEIHFVNGAVLRARPSESRPDAALAKLLIRVGVIADSVLADASRRQEESGEALSRILVSSKLLSADTLSEVQRLLTDETIFELFLWDDGRFSFQPEGVERNEGDELVGAEMVLLDALRMRDEWARIERQLDDLNVVIATGVDIEEFRAQRAALEKATGMQPDDLERIFLLVDGRLTARRAIDLSRLGTFSGGRALAGLLRAGLVFRDLPREAAPALASQGSPERPALAYAVLACGAALAGLLWIQSVPRSAVDYPLPEDVFAEVRYGVAGQRLRTALEAHRWVRGGYPESLEELDAFHDAVLAPLPVDRYSYARTADGYTLQRRLPE